MKVKIYKFRIGLVYVFVIAQDFIEARKVIDNYCATYEFSGFVEFIEARSFTEINQGFIILADEPF